MLKVLIVCKENQTAKKIINKILINIDNLRILGITNTLDETKDLLIKIEPDLIVTTNIHVIDMIKQNLFPNEPNIVLISKSKRTGRSPKNTLILDYSLSFSELSKKIFMYIQKNITHSQKEKAIELLTKFGFDFKLSGTVYLLDAIMYARTYKGSYSFEQLSRDIYCHIAEINNTTVDRVKWSIARSINYMHRKHTKESYIHVERYFNITYPERPTPKLIIGLMSNNLDL